jgi:Domain of unknown function (DUF4149)
MRWSDKLALLATTLWVGSLWGIGLIAAPTLFYQQPDIQLAGAIAGRMFTLVAYLGLTCGIYLLIHRFNRYGAKAMKQGYLWALFLMVVLTAIGHFGISPLMAELKAQALPSDVMHSVFASRFETWHGISSFAYALESLLGAVIVLKREH